MRKLSDPSKPATTAELTAVLAASRLLRDHVVYRGYEQGHAAERGPVPGMAAGSSFDPAPALAAMRITGLYSHQSEALELIAAGRNVLTVTPTASGKSLIYILPTLAALADDPSAHALYLFPYKALEQDQLGALQTYLRAASLGERVTAAIYDGDTPQRERKKLKAAPPGILITNPDMLHLGLLAYHGQWRALFANLRYVVIDELHVYRGIFGTHFHHVMRRLDRVCRQYGCRPQLIASSATIGNPGEFAHTLLGSNFSVVASSGAPRAGRHFLFVNPTAGSPYTVAAGLIERCVRSGFRTLAFTKARKITELLASWVTAAAPDLASRIASYRAGYLAAERRGIESRLARGELTGVISTSALEHGIDVGGLDVCILVGYPGSITSSWQRIGRVGRSGADALVILVALPDALDQYFMAQPRQFFERDFERVATDPMNPVIVSQHLTCAGAEIPLTHADRAFYTAESFAMIDSLLRQGALVADASGDSWYSLRRNPQRDVNLRAAGEPYTILDAETERTIGTVGGVRAFVECHEGAIYLHQGQQFEVVELDRDRRKILARRVMRDYYTQVSSEKETEILEVLSTRHTGGYRVSLGRLRVTQEFKEYLRRRINDQQTISRHPLDLPPLIFETVGLWWDIPEDVREEAARREHHFMGSIHACEHAAIALFPLLTISDRGDIGGISYPMHPQTLGPAIFIYDGYPGGIGLASRGFERIETLLGRTRTLVTGCPCEIGCPSCIHSPKCGSGNHPLDKAGARFVLEQLTLGQREPARPPAIVPVEAAGPPGGRSRPAAPAAGRAGGEPDPARRLLYFDLETRRGAEEVGGWDHIRDMGLALGVVYDEQAGQYRTYFEEDVDRLIIDLMSADMVVGFNVKRFDYVVLAGYRDAAYERIRTCDLLEHLHQQLGFRLKLNHLAEKTLGTGKSADGLQSLQWFRQGRLDLIERYCRQDVEVTRQLYLFGKKHGYLLYEGRDRGVRRVRVTW